MSSRWLGSAWLCSLMCAAFLQAVCPAAQARNTGLALTPPMGWNSWNKFGCNVSEQLVKSIADAMVSSGMKDPGCEYVIIDDCWQAGRDADGNFLPDRQQLRSAMKALADYMHARGLKFGIYCDAGARTCAGRSGGLGKTCCLLAQDAGEIQAGDNLAPRNLARRQDKPFSVTKWLVPAFVGMPAGIEERKGRL